MPKGATGPNYAIRHARPADIPAIRAMQERSMWVLGGDFYSSTEIANFLTEFGTMDDALVHEGHFFITQDDRGRILGSGCWSRLEASYAGPLGAGAPAACAPVVRSVFVDPAAARRGIGSAIMFRIEQDAAENDVRSLRLTATLSGVSLYRKLGYRVAEFTELVFPDQTSFGCVKMEKSLTMLSPQAA
jgi:GNAT superfamily N-acetyltransferase